MARNDPLRNMRFRVEIDQITQGYFSEVTMAETTVEPVEYREGTDPTHARKLPGLTKYGNVTLKWGVTDSTELYDWHKRVVDGGIKDARRTLKIVVLGEAGDDKASYLLSEAWPSKFKYGDLNAKSNEALIDHVEVVCEHFERTK